jgi:hypothetical protein
LAEAEKVLGYGDVRNADIALEAYGNEIAEVARLVGGKGGVDKEKLAELLDLALSRHQDVLNGLLDKLPFQALSGINNAIDASQKAKPIKLQGPPEDKITGKPEDLPGNNKNKDKETGKPDSPPGKP